MEYDANNVFAKILRKEIETKTIHESNTSLAFFDIYPRAKVHALVIPKMNVVSFSHFINKASETDIAKFFKDVELVIQKLGLQDGYRLITNTGKHGRQEIPHFHIHVMGGQLLP